MVKLDHESLQEKLQILVVAEDLESVQVLENLFRAQGCSTHPRLGYEFDKKDLFNLREFDLIVMQWPKSAKWQMQLKSQLSEFKDRISDKKLKTPILLFSETASTAGSLGKNFFQLGQIRIDLSRAEIVQKTKKILSYLDRVYEKKLNI